MKYSSIHVIFACQNSKNVNPTNHNRYIVGLTRLYGINKACNISLYIEHQWDELKKEKKTGRKRTVKTKQVVKKVSDRFRRKDDRPVHKMAKKLDMSGTSLRTIAN
jgi:hypothetical protein